MVIKFFTALTCVIASVVSLSANSVVVYWEPTNADVNFIYTTSPGFSLGIFDVDDFDTSQNDPLMLNAPGIADTINIAPAGGDFTASSTVTSNPSITLFNDNQFVIAITDGTSWSEPTSWDEMAPNSNIYNIIFSNGSVTLIDAVPRVVPMPAAVWLFGSGLIGLVVVARRKA